MGTSFENKSCISKQAMSCHITSGIWNTIANYNFHGQSHSNKVLSLASCLFASASACLFICFSASLVALALSSSPVSLYLTCLNWRAAYDQKSEEIAADTDLLISDSITNCHVAYNQNTPSVCTCPMFLSFIKCARTIRSTPITEITRRVAKIGKKNVVHPFHADAFCRGMRISCATAMRNTIAATAH